MGDVGEYDCECQVLRVLAFGTGRLTQQFCFWVACPPLALLPMIPPGSTSVRHPSLLLFFQPLSWSPLPSLLGRVVRQVQGRRSCCHARSPSLGLFYSF